MTGHDSSFADLSASVCAIRLLLFPPVEDKERVHHVYSLFFTKEFLAAIVGEVIGGLFAVFTQFLLTLWQRKSAQDAERRTVNGTLQAIATELKVLKASAWSPLDEQWKDLTKARELAANREAAEPLPFVKSRIEKNYLTFLNRTSPRLGE